MPNFIPPYLRLPLELRARILCIAIADTQRTSTFHDMLHDNPHQDRTEGSSLINNPSRPRPKPACNSRFSRVRDTIHKLVLTDLLAPDEVEFVLREVISVRITELVRAVRWYSPVCSGDESGELWLWTLLKDPSLSGRSIDLLDQENGDVRTLRNIKIEIRQLKSSIAQVSSRDPTGKIPTRMNFAQAYPVASLLTMLPAHIRQRILFQVLDVPKNCEKKERVHPCQTIKTLISLGMAMKDDFPWILRRMTRQRTAELEKQEDLLHRATTSNGRYIRVDTRYWLSCHLRGWAIAAIRRLKGEIRDLTGAEADVLAPMDHPVLSRSELSELVALTPLFGPLEY